tara:strand:- start:396 stop:785 length:390 start_codon:yes stop_codon:yes gene_type:complete
LAKPEKEVKAVGRPRLYSTPEDFDNKVLEYQIYCKEQKEPVTWTGLALFLGFSSRQSIDEYLKYDGFSDSVKRAKTFVEWHYEMKLHGNAPSGSIFALKNFGWTDKATEEMPADTLADSISKLIDKLPN